MRKIKIVFSIVAFMALGVSALFAQKTYEYKTVPGDPMQVREYTLDNGLKVFMSVYKDAPRIQTYIAVKAGSKNDPATTTGLAHYLEHMMFKGTEKLGTKDWEKEKVYIQQIEDLFEAYRLFDDEATRAAIYKKIDSLSYEASKLAIANEYDKSMTAIGSTGTNAFTSNDYTMYVENIPNNQLENWAMIQADRFQNLVLRLFHTELETIYEEKNMSLTNDGRKANEAMLSALFPNHPYGTQTTLGEGEHLKNPSMRNVRNFVATYYVPNNMAICMSGDFNPDEAIKIIDKYFGNMKPSPVPEFKFEYEKPLTQNITKEVVGLDAENTRIAFRINAGNGSDIARKADLLSSILNNGKCGLIDINLNQQQKCLGAYAGTYTLNDYTAFLFGGRPKQGQTLEELQQLLLEQIELVKKGEFPDWLLEATINNAKLSLMKQYESNQSRVSMMSYAFVQNQKWEDVVNELEEYSKITKKDLVDFANKYLSGHYVIINKRQGTPAEIAKVAKPPITPIEVGRDAESDFLKQIKANKVADIEPVFVDYKKELQRTKLANGTEMLYTQNVENKTFNLVYYFDFGYRADKTIDLAADLLDYLNTSKHTAEQLQQEFYKLACNFNLSVGAENISVSISGLSENMEKAMALVEEIFADVQPNDAALNNMVGDILKSRVEGKTNQKNVFNHLVSYGTYGPNSPAKDILTEAELKAYKSQQLVDAIKNLFGYKHRVLYYGPETMESMKTIVAKNHKTPKKLNNAPKNKEYAPLATNENKVYFVDYNAKQSYLQQVTRGGKYNPNIYTARALYNSYFGGGMNAIVFQEMREKRSLAYTAWANYQLPGKKDGYCINTSYIATQNDKVIDAYDAFNDLFNNMPVAEQNFTLAKESLISNIRTGRVTKMSIIWNYLSNEKMGYKQDMRKVLFEQLPTMTMQDVIDFNKKYIKNTPKTYMILGKEADMDFKTLEKKYGKVQKLSLEDVFGY